MRRKSSRFIAGIHRLVQPDFVEMESDLALIAVVGRGMKSQRALQEGSSLLLPMQM